MDTGCEAQVLLCESIRTFLLLLKNESQRSITRSRGKNMRVAFVAREESWEKHKQTIKISRTRDKMGLKIKKAGTLVGRYAPKYFSNWTSTLSCCQ